MLAEINITTNHPPFVNPSQNQGQVLFLTMLTIPTLKAPD